MNKKLAFVFPGQGSQSVGMLGQLAERFTVITETFEEASDILGYDLWHLVQNGPEDKLNQTEYTQPALLTAEVALWRLWQEQKGVLPLYMAGHSLGEYSALVSAEAISFTEAVNLVAKRGRFMQSAVVADQGGMVAIIGLDESAIHKICQEAAEGQILAPVNYNSIGQTVLSGDLAAVKRAVNLAKSLGVKKAKLIPVSVPAHCLLMKPAALELAKELQKIEIKPPEIPIINNVDVAIYDDAADIRDGLIRQLYSPVRWVEIIQYLHTQHIECFIECGPGKILAGLNKRIVKELPTKSIIEEDLWN